MDDCEFDNDGLCGWSLDGNWKRSRAGDCAGPLTDISFINGEDEFDH